VTSGTSTPLAITPAKPEQASAAYRVVHVDAKAKGYNKAEACRTRPGISRTRQELLPAKKR